MERLNYVSTILKKYNLKLINFNKLTDYKLDCNTDLFNETHINTDAATKFTMYFSKYLVDKYKLPDHRDELKFNSWYDKYDEFVNKYEKLTGRKFQIITDDGMIDYS